MLEPVAATDTSGLFRNHPVAPSTDLQIGELARQSGCNIETIRYYERIALLPRLGLALAKKAVNQVEDIMGLQTGMDSVFGLHHIAHAHNAEVGGDSLGGQTIRSMKRPSA